MNNELVNLLPGLLQGITRVSISYPADVVKVQMQKNLHSKSNYANFFHDGCIMYYDVHLHLYSICTKFKSCIYYYEYIAMNLRTVSITRRCSSRVMSGDDGNMSISLFSSTEMVSLSPLSQVNPDKCACAWMG